MSPARNLKETIQDPGAAAARGRWLARGAWLLAAAEVVLAVRNHISGRLTEKERKRMLEIVRSSKDRPSNLSDRQRKELRTLLGKVEPRELAKTVAGSGFAWGDFGIGAATMLGLVLVATGVFAATRRIPRTRVSS